MLCCVPVAVGSSVPETAGRCTDGIVLAVLSTATVDIEDHKITHSHNSVGGIGEVVVLRGSQGVVKVKLVAENQVLLWVLR